MQRIKKIRNVLLVCMLSVFLCCGCAGQEIVITTAFESDELMRINNKSCYLPEMMLYLTTVQNKYEEVYGADFWKEKSDGVTLEDKVKDNVLAKVAQVKVMNLMAESYNLKLTDEENTRVRDTSEKFYASLNDVEREKIGVSKEDIYNIYKEYALSNKVYEYVIADVNPEISDDEARTITILQIYIKDYALDSEGKVVEYSDRMKKEAYEKAELVRELALEEDASFESIALKYNEGEEITYTFGRGEMQKAIEDVAFSLDKNQVSDVIETDQGFYVIKCVSDFDLLETQNNKVAILKQRKEEAFDVTYNEFLTTLTKTLNDKLYDSIKMIHDPMVTTSSFFEVDF